MAILRSLVTVHFKHQLLKALDPVAGVWQTYTFDLLTLADAGLDLSAIDVVMVFPAWGAGAGAVYRVDNARIYNPNADIRWCNWP